jgi:hypothetical protein
MKYRVIQSGCYPTRLGERLPGSRKTVLERLKAGETLTRDERGDVEVRPGQVLDGDILHPAIVQSMLANGLVAPMAVPGQGEALTHEEAEEVKGRGQV